MSEQMNNVKGWFASRKDTLIRALYTVLFLIIGYFAGFLVFLIAIFQFVMDLLTGAPSQQVNQFARSLCTYYYELLGFVTYTTEHKPFPFSAWPSNGSSSRGGQGDSISSDRQNNNRKY